MKQTVSQLKQEINKSLNHVAEYKSEETTITTSRFMDELIQLELKKLDLVEQMETIEYIHDKVLEGVEGKLEYYKTLSDVPNNKDLREKLEKETEEIIEILEELKHLLI